jgi:hypothetical protein
MHQTTLRFGPDLWAALEVESERLGVSVAHFVRDAALTRLALSQAPETGHEHVRAQVSHRRPTIEAELSSTGAVFAQAQLARDRAARLSAEADRVRDRTAVKGR